MFDNIKSKFILHKILNYLLKRKLYKIIKYNKKIQQRLDLNINDYIEYSELYSTVEIEIIPEKSKCGRFIHLVYNKDIYHHIYYNDNKEKEYKITSFNLEDNVTKINVIIDNPFKSFKQLFSDCECVESINFIKFFRRCDDMSFMFSRCTSLKEINFSNFNTNKTVDMNNMFEKCSSLKELNLSSFNTNNLIEMSYMFSFCSSLEELNLSSFNTDNVTNMESMFYECS